MVRFESHFRQCRDVEFRPIQKDGDEREKVETGISYRVTASAIAVIFTDDV